MNKSSGISYLNQNDSRNKPGNIERATIDRLAEDSVRHLSEMLQSMFDGIDDSLFELANNARTNNEQNRFFEAMREIRIQRKGIEARFSQAIQHSFSPQAVQKVRSAPASPGENDSLSLVGNDDLEQDVAITSMASKARANFQGPLLQFHTRIGKLYGVIELDNINPPLEPISICQAFSEACNELDIEIKERLIVYKQFDRYVMSNLETVLDNANKVLIRKGVLPGLKTPGLRSKTEPRSERAPKPLSQNNEQLGQDRLYYQNQAVDIFPQFQKLLANTRTKAEGSQSSGHASTNRAANVKIIDSNDLIQLLNAIQRQPQLSTPVSDDGKVVDIRTALQAQLQQKDPGRETRSQLSQIDEDLINLVSMLFEFILEDYNLAPSIQVLISRLQIPILKVVIKDKSFFSSNKHPARQLLNSLAKAGIGWGESQDTGKDALYSQIQKTVHCVLDEFDGDISLFERLNQEFNAFIAREERKAKIVEQRTKEAEEGRIRSKQAQKRVEHVLSRKILNARHAVPKVVIEMLKNGWSRVMFLAYLKDDQEHQWAHTVRIAEELIWCLQPLSDQKDRQKWITIVPKLLKDLKSGLESVSYNAAQLDETIAEIKTALTSCFKDPSLFISSEQMASELKTGIPDLPDSAVEKQLSGQEDGLSQYLQQIDQLDIGQWVEFSLINGSKFRCKLSAKIDEADCLIFVNRMGLKSVEKEKRELAMDLKKKNVVILEQGPMIDRAMNAVMSSLSQKANV